MKCLHVQFCLSGLDETLQEVGHSRKADIRVSRLQDIRTSRCPVHHRSLHKLCNRYVATVRQTTGSLGQKGRGSSVSAGWLSHVRSNTHLELSIVLCVQGIFALNYHTKKKYQLFSYWFLLNSCEWRNSVNYIRVFFYISSLKGFLFKLVWIDGIIMKLCVFILLSWIKPLFAGNYISTSIKHLQWRRKMPMIWTVIRNLQF